jgi:anti-anti-sigma regulatory factor
MEVSRAMLRITIRNEDSATSFVIEGKLAWPWVEELRKCWRRAISCHQPQSIRVDFTAMTFIDSRGRDLLVQMHRQGATLEGSGLMITALIEEIKQM